VNYNNMCCAENEELSVSEPFHIQKGFKASESTVSLFRGWSVIGGACDGSIKLLIEGMKGVGGMGGITIIIDPLAAKSMKNEGFTTKDKLSQYLVNEVMKSAPTQPEGPRPRMLMAPVVNIVVVGGEWNPFFITTNFHYSETGSVDKWIPKSGVKRDARPLRMPVQLNCNEGVCGLSGNLLSDNKH
jgi:hypothetical protein